MSLVKKVVFEANIHQRLAAAKLAEHFVETNNGSKLFWACANHSSEPLLKRALTDRQYSVKVFNPYVSFCLMDQFNGFHNQPVPVDVPKLRK